MKHGPHFKSLATEIRKASAADRKLTLGELLDLAEKQNARVSDVVIAEAMASHEMSHDEVIEAVLGAFKFNLLALEIGLSHGNSFLLGSIGRELQESRKRGAAVIGDRFVDKAVVYTIATEVGNALSELDSHRDSVIFKTEVGNHEVGLQPCAGTGDSCVYTGLLKALLETKRSRLEVGRLAALMVKIGTFFKEGKKTTGCNMEGFGAGAACTAAARIFGLSS